MNNSSDKINALRECINLSQKVPVASDLNEIYEISEQISKNVKVIYPDIYCRAGCNACCKNYGTPKVFNIEWENIKNILDNSDDEFRNKVKQGVNEIKENYIELMKKNSPPDVLNIINNVTCPFLHNEVCSIYSKRPIVCRTFGGFLSRPFLDKISAEAIYTCIMEKERWDKKIFDENLTSLMLPHMKNFMDRIKIFNGERNEAKGLLSYLDSYFQENE